MILKLKVFSPLRKYTLGKYDASFDNTTATKLSLGRLVTSSELWSYTTTFSLLTVSTSPAVFKSSFIETLLFMRRRFISLEQPMLTLSRTCESLYSKNDLLSITSKLFFPYVKKLASWSAHSEVIFQAILQVSNCWETCFYAIETNKTLPLTS